VDFLLVLRVNINHLKVNNKVNINHLKVNNNVNINHLLLLVSINNKVDFLLVLKDLLPDLINHPLLQALLDLLRDNIDHLLLAEEDIDHLINNLLLDNPVLIKEDGVSHLKADNLAQDQGILDDLKPPLGDLLRIKVVIRHLLEIKEDKDLEDLELKFLEYLNPNSLFNVEVFTSWILHQVNLSLCLVLGDHFMMFLMLLVVKDIKLQQ